MENKYNNNKNNDKYNDAKTKIKKPKNKSIKIKKQENNILTNAYKRLNRTIRKKNDRVIKFIGCSSNFLRWWLEKKFDSNMSWDNLNSYWTIQFIKPVESFNFVKKGQQKLCFNWKNLVPCKKNCLFIKTPFENLVEELNNRQSSNYHLTEETL
jgi:hypothetical protein